MKPKLMKYNPAFFSHDELVGSFVVRQADLKLIIEILKGNSGNPNQQILLIGERGMGKTMLVLRAAAYIANDKELSAIYYPLVFNEESYEVFTAAEFWLCVLFHLSKQERNKNLMRLHEQLKREKDDKRLYERVLACLTDFADEKNKRLLLVVENLNMLLEQQIGSKETWNIRHTLLNEPRIILLATAPTRFDEIENAGKAMSGLFKIHYLEPLNTFDSKVLWEFLTGQQVEEKRIRPIQILTGGNPRLLAIISSFAAGTSLRKLMRPLAILIDEYTTYFRSNIEILPPLERKIFVTLANIWEPATAKRVAYDTRIPVNKASSLLKRLESRGRVIVVKSFAGKKIYQISERLYNIYYLMRLSGSQSDRVHAVIDFMMNFYEGEEPAKKMTPLTEEARFYKPEVPEDHLEAYNEIIKTAKRNEKWRQILQSITPEFFEIPELSKLLVEIADKYHPFWKSVKEYFHLGQNTYRKKEKIPGASIEKNHAENPIEQYLSLEYILLLQEESIPKDYDFVEKIYRNAIKIDPKASWAWMLLGSLLQGKPQRYEEAEEAYRTAIDISPEIDQAWIQLGELLHEKLERYDEAEESYRRAIEINPQNDRTWGKLGKLLHYERGRYIEAGKAYQRAIEINPQNAAAWANLGMLFHNGLERYDEAEKAYRKAIEIDSTFVWTWIQLIKLLIETAMATDQIFDTIFKYLDIFNRSPECIHEITRIILETNFKAGLSMAEQLAKEALRKKPGLICYQHTFASILGSLGKWQEALAIASQFVRNPEPGKEFPGNVISFFIDAAIEGHAAEGLKILKNSACALYAEPLIVALQMLTGEEYNAPQEVVEVAKDILKQIEEKKSSPRDPSCP
jgi:tetratricopeptide (TPR) repeat protein